MLPAINGVNMFPQDDVPVAKKKEKEWGTQAAMAIYQMLLQSNTYYNQQDWADWTTLRLYAVGKQDILGYKKWYTGLTNNNGNLGAQRINTEGFDEFNPVGTGSRDIVRGNRVFSPMDYSVVSPLPKVVHYYIIDTKRGKLQGSMQKPQSRTYTEETRGGMGALLPFDIRSGTGGRTRNRTPNRDV